MKKVIIALALIGVSISGYSQSEEVIKEKKISFGFNVGGNYSLMKSRELNESSISNGAGFRLGILMNYKLDKKFFISPKAELSFNNNKINLSNSKELPIYQKFYKTNIELMTHFILKRNSSKLNPYLLAGPNVRIPIVAEDEKATDLNTSMDVALDVGIGFEKRLPFFNVMPEIRLTTGFNNVNNSLGPKVYFNNITLVLNFTGK